MTDPIGIFESGSGGGGIAGFGGGGGGGCYVNPRFNSPNNNSDNSMLILLTVVGLYALYRLSCRFLYREYMDL